MKKFIPFVFLVLTIGCEHTPVEDYKTRLNIFTILNPTQHRQAVTVDKTYKMDEVSSKGVNNAIVILKYKNISDTLAFSDSLYLSQDSIPVNPQDTFSITIKAPGFDSVFGTTIVPDSVTILHPANGDSVKQSDSLVIKNDKGKYYRFTIYKEDSLWWQQEEVPSQTDSLMIIQFSWFILTVGNYKINIETYDENYTEYCTKNKDFAGITGGLGTIGSMVTKTISLYLKE